MFSTVDVCVLGEYQMWPEHFLRKEVTLVFLFFLVDFVEILQLVFRIWNDLKHGQRHDYRSLLGMKNKIKKLH